MRAFLDFMELIDSLLRSDGEELEREEFGLRLTDVSFYVCGATQRAYVRNTSRLIESDRAFLQYLLTK